MGPVVPVNCSPRHQAPAQCQLCFHCSPRLGLSEQLVLVGRGSTEAALSLEVLDRKIEHRQPAL